MAHSAQSESPKSRSYTQQRYTQDLAVLVTPIERKPENTMVSGQVILKATGKTSVLVSTQARSVIELNSHDNVSEMRAGMTGKEVAYA